MTLELYFGLMHNFPKAVTPEIKREMRAVSKHKAWQDDSMKETEHYINDRDGEGYTEFAIFEDNGESDEEIHDFVNEKYRIQYIDRGFDCSGQLFTSYLHWKRIPCGIAVIHHATLDI